MRFRFGSRGCHGPATRDYDHESRDMGMRHGMGMGRHGGEHHDRGFGFRGGPGMRGRPRMFEQGDLRFAILKLLSDKPAHGYELIKAVEERFGGNYAPSPGIVYPTLTLLEELGQIAVVQTDGAKKLYDITPDGRAALDANRPTVDRIFARMDEMRQRFGGGPAPQVVRAMENLKMAMRLKLDAGITADQATAIANVLDEAAKGIERA